MDRPVLALLLALCLVPSRAVAHPDIDEVLAGLARESAARAGDPTFALEQAAARRIAGDFDGALVAITHAEAHGAPARDVALARADVFVAARWLRSARRHLDRLVAADPDDADARMRRARVLVLEGAPAAAARDYARALAVAVRPRPAHYIEHRDALVAAGDPAGALAALDAGIARLGPIVSLELPAAALALDLGRPDDALARIDDLIAASPPNPLLLARRGEVLAHAGHASEARKAYEAALALLERRPARRRSERAAALEDEIRTALGASIPPPTEETR